MSNITTRTGSERDFLLLLRAPKYIWSGAFPTRQSRNHSISVVQVKVAEAMGCGRMVGGLLVYLDNIG